MSYISKLKTKFTLFYIENKQFNRSVLINSIPLIKPSLIIWAGISLYLLVQAVMTQLLLVDLAIALSAVVTTVLCIPFIQKGPSKTSEPDPILYGAGISLGMIMIGAYLSQVINDPNMVEYTNALQRLSPVTLVVNLLIFAPVSEELFFRGFLYTKLQDLSIGKYLAMIISSIMFVIVHGTFVHIIPAFIMGITFCLVYEYTNNILYGIVCHSLYNLLTILLGFVIKEVNLLTLVLSIILVGWVLWKFSQYMSAPRKGELC